MKRRAISLMTAGVLLVGLTIAGCDGKVGPVGPTGPPGESGVVIESVFDQVEVLLTNTTTKPLGQIQITSPVSGTVFVVATVDVQVSKPQPVPDARVFFSIHTDGTSEITDRHEVAILRVTGETTQLPESFIMPVTLNRTFSVSAGSNTFFLRGARNDASGSNMIQVFNKRITAIHIPD